MDRQELNEETRATKKVNKTWIWIIAVGLLLMVIAFVGGVFNHDGNVAPGSTPTPGAMSSDTVNGDAYADTLATDSRN
ncbi:hypothetical protein [Arundinibacter roseus]|uniref:Uncharacterized protein n=1 Tax=Arundinibacter roseus TaxID=2070510 RepID=A0A4R4KCZ8_9BACT|nr:hypothetical protein [Arundinibacter roseus]TDB64209.1 hypothetical protein EZE20_14850 [Arundinibacter roseus]